MDAWSSLAISICAIAVFKHNVHTLSLIRPNDNVGQGRALLEEEHSIGVTTFSLFRARAGAAVIAEA